jgi:hypothetical protein
VEQDSEKHVDEAMDQDWLDILISVCVINYSGTSLVDISELKDTKVQSQIGYFYSLYR